MGFETSVLSIWETIQPSNDYDFWNNYLKLYTWQDKKGTTLLSVMYISFLRGISFIFVQIYLIFVIDLWLIEGHVPKREIAFIMYTEIIYTHTETHIDKWLIICRINRFTPCDKHCFVQVSIQSLVYLDKPWRIYGILHTYIEHWRYLT